MFTRIEEESAIAEKELKVCFHCGDECRQTTLVANDKIFCCEGCRLVFEIISENRLGGYYELNPAPGTKKQSNQAATQFDFLDDIRIREKLISFSDGKTTHITFFVPQIHCSSCIWLLEHLHKFNNGIIRSTVNFLKREVSVVFLEEKISIRQIAKLFNRIGYPPKISLDQADHTNQIPQERQNWYKLGVAFFCFGNIMLLSFPEYFGMDELIDKNLRSLFGYLNILLSLPVLLYAGTGFFKSAYLGLKQGKLNMDFPISLGIIVMYARSLFEILSGTGSGYMDTFAGLIFFMLSGRMFQNKTFARLSFERDYKSYFPIAVAVIEKGAEVSRPVSDLKRGDRMVIRNEEIIPADSILLKGEGRIDYSFVTGESIPVSKRSGDRLYAGGKQTGAAIELEVINEVSQSRLTQLWNDINIEKHGLSGNVSSLTDRVSRVFTVVVVLVALLAGSWYIAHGSWQTGLNAFTAVLIITCPCALALSYPFTLGNSIRIFGKNGFYLKNTAVIETLSHIDTIVFDKTGTLTHTGKSDIGYMGKSLSELEKSIIFSLCNQSNHPLSRLLSKHLLNHEPKEISLFREYPGQGIEGVASGYRIRIGSSAFTGADQHQSDDLIMHSCVHISINENYIGMFTFKNVYRSGIQELIYSLADKFRLHVLSGDKNSEKTKLETVFGKSDLIRFNQKPADKLNYLKELMAGNNKVIMIGDGLNDAGALIQSNVGIAVTESINNFTPASDAIMEAESLKKLPIFIRFARFSMAIIIASYIISILYNTFGIYIAIQGNLSPLFAAVFMPLSTVTIVLFTTLASTLVARKLKLIV